MSEPQSMPSDSILDMIVAMVEWAESDDAVDVEKRSIAITLTVGGLLISGDLISSKTYMDELMNGILRDKIKSAIEENEDLKQLVQTAPKRKDDFIHLRDAKFLLPSQRPIPGIGNGVLWRGRLNSVDGFFLGRLGLSENN